jgi:hypothetical protein
MAHDPFGEPNEAEDDEDFIVEGLDEADGKFKVDDGDYEAKVIEAKKEISKSSNAPQAVLTVALTGKVCVQKRILDPKEGASPAGGKEFKSYSSIKALWKINELLIALGFDDLAGQPSVKVPLKKMVGRYCVVTMKQEDYQGRMSSKVQSMLPHPNGHEG